MRGNYQIPFDPKTGDQQFYPSPSACEWRDNFQVQTRLVLDYVERGRSAAHFIFQTMDDDTLPAGTRVYMFLTDVEEVIACLGIHPGGVIDATPRSFLWDALAGFESSYPVWTFRKQGLNYGITLADGMTINNKKVK